LIASTATPSEEERRFDTFNYANDMYSQDEHGFSLFTFRPTHSGSPWRGPFTCREDRKTNYHQIVKEARASTTQAEAVAVWPAHPLVSPWGAPQPFGGGRESVPKPSPVSSRGEAPLLIF